jgi:hypothetical protein
LFSNRRNLIPFGANFDFIKRKQSHGSVSLEFFPKVLKSSDMGVFVCQHESFENVSHVQISCKEPSIISGTGAAIWSKISFGITGYHHP